MILKLLRIITVNENISGIMLRIILNIFFYKKMYKFFKNNVDIRLYG